MHKKKAVELKAIWSRKQNTSQLKGISPADDAACLKPKGRQVAEKRREKNATHVNIFTYNVKTLSTDEEMNNLLEEIKKIEWDVIGLCESIEKERAYQPSRKATTYTRLEKQKNNLMQKE